MENKPWYLSKTIWGTAITLVALVAPKVVGWLGATPDEATATVLTIADGVAAVVGAALAIYGRVKADKKITK